MTEPQKMGLEEVMGLVDEYAESRATDQRLKHIFNSEYSNKSKAKVRQALTTIIADRDALREHVCVLEAAVKKAFADSDFCPFCGTRYTCEADCIVRTINPQP